MDEVRRLHEHGALRQRRIPYIERLMSLERLNSVAHLVRPDRV